MKYSPEYKHRVLQHYKEKTRGSGFLALAKRFAIKGGKREVRRWFARWNGRVESLGRRTGSGRPQILTQKEKKTHILKFVEKMNKKGEAVDYPAVLENVREKTNKGISLRQLRDIGRREFNLRWKKTTRTLVSQGQFDREETGSTLIWALVSRDSRLSRVRDAVSAQGWSRQQEQACLS